MRRALQHLFPLVLWVGLGCGLGSTRGSGKLKTESRPVAAFHALDVSGGIHAVLDVGPISHLEVRADDNLLPLLKTEVQGGTLRISWSSPEAGGVRPTEATVTVSTSALDSLVVRGGAPVEATHLAGPALTWEGSGGSVGTLSGQVEVLHVDASGGSVLKAHDLVAQSATVSASGGSVLQIQAAHQVDAELSGGSVLTLNGHPGVVNQTVSGGSTVQFE